MPEVFEFSRDMTSLRRFLKPAGGARGTQQLVHEFYSCLQPIVDAVGTGRYADAAVERAATANSAVTNAPSTPAAGFVRYVFYAHVFHSVAGAGTRICWITVQIRDTGGTLRVLKVCPHATVDNATPVELPRPIVLPPLATLQGRASVATGAGEDIVLEYFFVDVPIGEYVVTP